jgi:hypothetical protein
MTANISTWFDDLRSLLESAYVRAQEPWQGSGFGLNTPRTRELTRIAVVTA